MEWVHVSDLVAGRSMDPDFIPKILAYVEARAAYETLDKVMQLLYEASRAGLVSEELADTIGEWYRNVEEEYRFRQWEIDGWFRTAYEAVRKAAGSQAEVGQKAGAQGA